VTLKIRALSGVKWTGFATVVITLTSLTQLSVLARLLGPEAFGLMAILMVVIGFAQAFMDMGISNAIIHKQSISHSQLSSLYWLSVFSGMILLLVIFLISPLVARFYEEPALQQPMKILSLVFLIGSIGSQYKILCQKELQFNTIAKIDITCAISGLSVAVFLAWIDFGVYALVFGMLTQASVSSTLYLIVGLKQHHVPSFSFRHKDLNGFYSFGLYQMGERSINYISANFDKIIIGKMLGMEAVGFYNIAWQLIIFPLSKINPIVNNVAFPIYAKVQSDPVLLNNYYSITVKALSLITIPMLVFLSFFSTDIVFIIFGAGWNVTANLVKILAIVGILKALGNPGGAILMAKGYANIGFWWNMVWSTILVIGLYLSLSYKADIETVPWVLLILSIISAPVWHYLISRFGAIKYKPIIIHIGKTIIICFLIAFIAVKIINYFEINSHLKIILSILICAVMYFPYLWLFEKHFIKKIRK